MQLNGAKDPAKRQIPLLKTLVTGVHVREQEVFGVIVPLAKRYAEEGADELVFYDINASSDGRLVDKSWVTPVAEVLDIPL